jgi:hypothetical protein
LLPELRKKDSNQSQALPESFTVVPPLKQSLITAVPPSDRTRNISVGSVKLEDDEIGNDWLKHVQNLLQDGSYITDKIVSM